MATCKQCREFEKCKDDAFINGAKFDPNESAKYCTCFETITNADRIRAMSDEELEDLFREVYNNGCDDATAWEWGIRQNTFIWDEEWLKQPAE